MQLSVGSIGKTIFLFTSLHISSCALRPFNQPDSASNTISQSRLCCLVRRVCGLPPALPPVAAIFSPESPSVVRSPGPFLLHHQHHHQQRLYSTGEGLPFCTQLHHHSEHYFIRRESSRERLSRVSHKSRNTRSSHRIITLRCSLFVCSINYILDSILQKQQRVCLFVCCIGAEWLQFFFLE